MQKTIQEIIEIAKERLKEGESFSQIAKTFNIQSRTLKRNLPQELILKYGRKKKLNGCNILECINLYQAGNPKHILAKKFNVDYRTIHDNLNKFKIFRTTGEGRRKYKLKEDFFKVIDTEEKAYILGLLFADGYISSTNNSIGISLGEKDKEILEKINKIVYEGESTPLKLRKLESDKRQNQYILSMNSQKMCNDLIDLGCVRAKSLILEFPIISDNLLNHFVRGYFDGDGHIPKVLKASSTVIVGTIMFNKILQDKIKHLFTSSIYHYNKEKTTCTLVLSGEKNQLNFFNWLYKDATIFMNRKHQRYLNNLNLI
jgi:LAGLIDADG-like domain